MTALEWLSPVTHWLFMTTIKASILTVLILLIQAWFRYRLPAQWRYALWSLLIIRMILPFGLESRLSIFNLISIDEQSLFISNTKMAKIWIG